MHPRPPQRFVDCAEAGDDLVGALQPAMSLYLVQSQHVQTLLSQGDRFLRQFEEDAGDRQQGADERQNGARLLEITPYQVTGGSLDDGRRTGKPERAAICCSIQRRISGGACWICSGDSVMPTMFNSNPRKRKGETDPALPSKKPQPAALTSIFFGAAFVDLGSVTVSTPLSNDAAIFSRSTSSGSEKERWKAP